MDRRVPLTAYAGVFAYALVLRLIGRGGGLVAERLHEGELPFKPLAVGPLVEGSGRVPRVLVPGAEYRLEVFIFREDYEEVFKNSLLGSIGAPLELPACRVVVNEAECWFRSWDDLRKSGEELGVRLAEGRRFRLRFLTPCQLGRLTRWRHPKPIFRLFPDPVSVVRSLARHWNAFASCKVDAEGLIAWAEDHLFERAYALRTRAIPLGEGRVTVGFVGWCEYEARELDERVARELGVLLNYAQFAGVGKHRTLGMGRVMVELPILSSKSRDEIAAYDSQSYPNTK